jgi:hypothetical protein
LIIAQRAAYLSALHITTESSTGRHAYEAIELDALLHHYVQDSGGVQATQSTPFKN